MRASAGATLSPSLRALGVASRPLVQLDCVCNRRLDHSRGVIRAACVSLLPRSNENQDACQRCVLWLCTFASCVFVRVVQTWCATRALSPRVKKSKATPRDAHGWRQTVAMGLSGPLLASSRLLALRQHHSTRRPTTTTPHTSIPSTSPRSTWTCPPAIYTGNYTVW